MRMKPIFSTSRNQSDAKKPDDDWQEQFFKLDVQYIVSQQVSSMYCDPPHVSVIKQRRDPSVCLSVSCP